MGENTIMSRIPVQKVQFYLRQPGNVAPDIQVGESPVTVGRGSCPNITDKHVRGGLCVCVGKLEIEPYKEVFKFNIIGV